MMKIVHVGQLPPLLGGAAFRNADLVLGLAQRSHQLTALAPRWPGLDHDDSALDAHLRVIRFDMPGPYVHLSDPAFWARQREQVVAHVERLAARGGVDVIVAGDVVFLPGIPDLAARLGVPSALFAQTSRPWRQELGACGDRFLDEMAKADLVVCCARHLHATFASTPLRRTATVPNGIDTGRFRPLGPCADLRRRLGVPAGALVALHASNLKPRKRPLDLLASAELVLRERPDVIYLVVGDGPERGALEEACWARGLSERFRVVGPIDHARMPDHLALADLMIAPSETEAMSLICLEAMACGKVVIVSDIPGMREIVRHGETGLLFEQGDAGDLARQTLRAAADPALRARIGHAARTYVEQHHWVENMVAGYEALLLDLVERQGHGGRAHRPAATGAFRRG